MMTRSSSSSSSSLTSLALSWLLLLFAAGSSSVDAFTSSRRNGGAFGTAAHQTSTTTTRSSSSSTTTTQLHAVTEKPFCVIVKAEIEPDRMAEFLQLIETNARETRKEPGCLRFDVLRSQDATNEFFFYELYRNAAAVDFHKEQAHYNLWAAFKESGGTVSSTSYKTTGEFLT